MDSLLGRIVATVLGLLALVAVGSGIYQGFGMDTTSQIVTDMSSTVVNARSAFAQGTSGYSSFSNANVTQLINNDIFPSGMVRGGALYDRWGNAVTISSQNAGMQGVITFGGGGSEDVNFCAKTAVSMNAVSYVSMKVGATTFPKANAPDPVQAANACATGLQFTLVF